MAFFLQQGVRTILFGQARQSVERMVRQVREQLPASLQQSVMAYRAGYMHAERKEIQQRLAAGTLLGVVSTNALELGIDIGHLDVSILDGYPGSVASFWQQAGRAGRRERSALTILVLRQDALDQYFALHPEKLLEGDHSISGANRLLVMKVPFHFPSSTDADILCSEITATEEEHEQHRADWPVSFALTGHYSGDPFW